MTMEDSEKTRLVDYTSELLYSLLVMLLSGAFQFDINFALTGKWKVRDFEFWWFAVLTSKKLSSFGLD